MINKICMFPILETWCSGAERLICTTANGHPLPCPQSHTASVLLGKKPQNTHSCLFITALPYVPTHGCQTVSTTTRSTHKRCIYTFSFKGTTQLSQPQQCTIPPGRELWVANWIVVVLQTQNLPEISVPLRQRFPNWDIMTAQQGKLCCCPPLRSAHYHLKTVHNLLAPHHTERHFLAPWQIGNVSQRSSEVWEGGHTQLPCT